MRRFAFLAALVPMLAAAQSAPLGTEQGFFKPTPDGDPSLTRPRPQDAQAQRAPFAAVQPQPMVVQPHPMVVQPQPMAVQPQPMAVQPVQAIQAVQPEPAPATVAPEGVVTVTRPSPEEELDRSKREAEEARVRAVQQNPAPITGAFTGSTSERDR